jgi:hypothetical protein
MPAVNKQDFLRMLDEHLPDDAMISGLSGMSGDGFSILPDNLDSIICPASEQDPEDIVSGSTHVLVTL